MSNKKFTEFPEGAFDTSKIILQADPTSGALEKIPFSKFPKSSYLSYSKFKYSYNEDPGECRFFEYDIPANAFAVDGTVLISCGMLDVNPHINPLPWNWQIGDNSVYMEWIDMVGTFNYRIECIVYEGGNLNLQKFIYLDGTCVAYEITGGYIPNLNVPIPTFLRCITDETYTFTIYNRYDIIYPASLP